ncbi:MAG TPA: HD domain-containing protein [Ignavibacteriaceae bacterium]|nr:HD domain-containing protein [Ignavibacteriaceae bacterium]
MKNITELKKSFKEKQTRLFNVQDILADAYKFSITYSITIEQLIRDLTKGNALPFVIASCGSFSRRELSPYSDIDVMFIVDSVEKAENEIQKIVTGLWDTGIEVSHTIRTISDIKHFLEDDLHAFTQFFETRFITGSRKLYDKWKDELLNTITEDVQLDLYNDLIEDTELRYKKFGNSPKVIEPNVKMSAGGLRDLQLIEWMYFVKTKKHLNKQAEKAQSEIFIEVLQEENYTSAKECQRLYNGYKFILAIRHILHLFSKRKSDRLEFADQVKFAKLFNYKKDGYRKLMKQYFEASNVINRYSKSFIKKIKSSVVEKLPDILAIDLDDEFCIKGETIYYKGTGYLRLSDILRGFYYRGLYSAHFDEKLRMLIIDSLDNITPGSDHVSSVFFREIFRLPKNVGATLSVMNELGVLGAFLPEFNDMNGFVQHGVYHCYTADEHTLVTISNLELLADDHSELGKIYNQVKEKDTLYLALLFHDIAKPINVAGHEIIGAEIAFSVMSSLGYSDEKIEDVSFLVKNHLLMEQVAFRRNLNDPDTLDSFVARFNSIEQLNLLYLVTYADLSAVNPALWTTWKSELLKELYRKAHSMIADRLSGEELLINTAYILPHEISKHTNGVSETEVQDHIDLINDSGYLSLFSDEEIALHIDEINSGILISVLFKEIENFTNITVITHDSPFLLSKLCGVMSINDLNIHDAKIFTRKDGIVIDNFNVTDFRTGNKIDPVNYQQIEESFNLVASGMLQLGLEIKRMKTKWWRIENKFFKRPGHVTIKFEETEKYTIIDIFSPDRLGFLYQVTRKMNELGLHIYFAKIATKGDEIVDSFYVLDRNKRKVSVNYYSFIEAELTEAIKQIL